MAGTRKEKQAPASAKEKPSSRDAEWTHGLKRLYDSVVDEPLPDSFQDLLSKLDAGE
ncbi:NepR family anti-sigma factor [Tsuneonella sp. HG222]